MSELKQIEFSGYKSFRECKASFTRLNILLGANGAGKSNFISIFNMVRSLTNGELQGHIVSSGGANAILHNGRRSTDSITIKLGFGRNGYRCTLKPTSDDRLYIESEWVIFYGDYVDKVEYLIGSNNFESSLSKYSERNQVAKHSLDSMKTWKIYHFHDTSESSPIKQPSIPQDSIALSKDAANLPSILLNIKINYPPFYRRIIESIRAVAPFFDDFVLEETGSLIPLRWKKYGSENVFGASQLSDGTIRFIALSTLLNQPIMPTTTIIDEPELGLHPHALNILSDLMKSASKRTQIIASTQSIGIVDNLEIENLIIFDTVNGASSVSRPNMEFTKAWLDDYSLGEVWRKNIIGGRPK